MLSTKSEDEVQVLLHGQEEEKRPRQAQDNNTWYHVGPDTLRDARVQIADFSLPRARQRLELAKEQARMSAEERARVKQASHKWIQSVRISGSQVSGMRATSSAEFSPDSKHIISSNWSGQVTVWSIPDCEEGGYFDGVWFFPASTCDSYSELRLTGHNSQVGCVKFHPSAYVGADPLQLNAASCDHDGRVLLWNLTSSQPIDELEKHSARVSRLAFHPSGKFLATCW